MSHEEENSISEALENILFKKDNLNTLKSAIKKVDTGQITSQELWDLIIRTRATFIEQITEYLLFLKKQHSDLQAFTNSAPDNAKNHSEEKDALLKELGIRINKIYTKLREKIQS